MRYLLPVALLLVACKTPRPIEGTNVVSAEEAMRKTGAVAGANTLGSGDLIEVRVYQEPELSGGFRVGPEGTIDYPFCGKVTLKALTASQASDALTQCLKQGYLKSPQVSVLIREYNSKKVFVFGEVQKPGTFPFEENMSIIQAVTLAGGFTKTAARNSIAVTRTVDGQEKRVRVPVEDIGTGREKNFALQPGDIVFVPESLF